MKAYYYWIKDWNDNEIIRSKYFTNSRHCANSAKEELAKTPPAKDFRITYTFIPADQMLNLLNAEYQRIYK